MSWPTATTPTTYVDADSDPIWRARTHIKQDIDNVNDIIDTFDPTGAGAGARLIYNESTSKFESNTQTNVAIISFNSTLTQTFVDSASDDAFDYYTGGLTVDYQNTTGIQTGTAGGHTTITFPQGSYTIEMANRQQSLGSNALQLRYEENDGTVHFVSTIQNFDLNKKMFYYKNIVTFSNDTVLKIKYSWNNVSAVQHQDIKITRIA